MAEVTGQKPRALKFLRSKLNPRAFLIDDDLNLYPFECSKRGDYVVIDAETGDDITRILIA